MQGSSDELVFVQALEVEHRGEVAAVDAGRGPLGDHRLGALGDPQARGLDHGQVVGAVADGQGGLGPHA